MNNGVLIFIIIIEAIVIVWQASKLKQFQKFEQLFNAGNAGSATAESSAIAGPVGKQNAQTNAQVSGQATASAASAAVAEKLAANADADDDEELMDMPGVDPESNIEEAKRVQLVMARCRYAEFYLDQLDDDYELGQFQRIVKSCVSTARNITDPFFRASALHPLIVLLDKAEWNVERDQLLAEVDDELVKERINDELASA